MTVTIDLPAEVESKIKTQASTDGLNVEDYLKILIKEESERRERIRNNSEKTLDEVLAPVRQDFEESGMSEDELNKFIDDLREKVWMEKQNV